mgnify:CR=1 FL=1
MRTRWKLRLFPYENMDYKAAEVWLNRQGEKGWALERVWFSALAVFSRSEREDLRYCIDLHKKWDATQDDGYFQLCNQAGWDYVAQVRNMAIFSARPVAEAVPLQTDRTMEERLYWRRAILPTLLDSLIGLLLLAALVAAIGLVAWGRDSLLASWSAQLCSTSFLCLLLSAVFCVLELVWAIPSGFLHWRRWKRAVEEDEPIPAASPLWSRLEGLVGRLGGFLFRLYLLFYFLEAFFLLLVGYSGSDVLDHRPEYQTTPLVMAEDVGLDGEAVDYLSYKPVLSPMVRGTRYLEEVDTGEGLVMVWCDRYTCATEWYAQLLTSALWKDSARSNYEGHGVLEFQMADLGTEEGWTARKGSFLLLREGQTVALVGVQDLRGDSPDLTMPEQLQTILTRLDLR